MEEKIPDSVWKIAERNEGQLMTKPTTKASQPVTAKPGMKCTESWLIPNGWELCRFEDAFRLESTASLSRECLTYEPTNSKVYYIHYGDIRATFLDNILDVSKEDRIPAIKDDVDFSSSLLSLEDGDLVIVDASEDYTGVCKCIEVANVNRKRIIAGLHTFLARGNKKSEKGYRCYILQNQYVSKQLKRIATGISVYSVSKGNLQNLPIVLPPLPEQKAIAEILGTWDSAIETTKQLIAEKERRKKWLMQQLLTGKKRLKGFTTKDKWKKSRLIDIASFINGRAYKLSEWENEGTPVIRLQNLTGSGSNYYYSNLELPDSQYCEKGDLLFMWSATFGPYIWKGEKAIYHYHIWKVECDSTQLDKMFFFYRLSEITEGIKRSSSNGGTMLHITKDTMEKMKVSIPELPEQLLIADFFKTIDEELSLLSQKLDALKEQKKGLMQKLLTGQVRVKGAA